MGEPPPATRHGARRSRGARVLAAGALAAVAIFGASRAGSGSDRSQPPPATVQFTLGPPRAYSVTSTRTTTVILHRRGRPVTATRAGRVVRVSAATKG